MKVNIEALAEKAVKFGGLRESQAAGLAVLFRVVERAAFCDGVQRGRSGSFAQDPSLVYDDEYSSQAATAPNRKAATTARRQRKAKASEAVGPVGEHSEQASSVDAVDPAATNQHEPSTRVKSFFFKETPQAVEAKGSR